MKLAVFLYIDFLCFFSPDRVSLVQKQLNVKIYCFVYKLLVCDVLVAVASLDLKITHQKCYFPFFCSSINMSIRSH